MEIYDTGSVRVGSFLTTKSPFEALRSIAYTKLPEGGGVLVIVTDRKTHTIAAGTSDQRQEARGRALEAAGREVLLNPRRS